MSADGKSRTGNVEFTPDQLSGPTIDRRTTLQLLGAVGLGGLAGCSTGPGGTDEPDGTPSGTGDTPGPTDTPPESADIQGGVLRAGWKDTEAENLDPAFSGGHGNLQIGANLFNALLKLDGRFRLNGDLAKDWSVLNDGKTLEFDLHDEVYFHDDWEGVEGNQFVPEDFRYSLRRTIEEDSTYKGHYTPIEPLDEGGVEVVDDTTLRIHMKFAFAPMFVFLTRTYGRGAIVHSKEAVEEFGDQYLQQPVGTGAFKVKENNLGGKLVLAAHENYFKTDSNGNQLPYLDEIEFSFLPESSTLVNALRAEEVDFINAVPQSQMATIAPADNIAVDSPPGGNWFSFQFVLDSEPLSSLKFRQGVNKLMDDQEFIDKAILGFGEPAAGPIPPAQGRYYREEKPMAGLLSYDPEAGRQLIREAGYGHFLDSGDPAFTVNVTTTWANGLRMGRVLRQLLSREGLTVEINQLPVSTFWEKWGNRDYECQISSSSGDADPDQTLYNFWRIHGQGGVWNKTYYGEKGETLHDQEVHEKLAEQRRIADLDERAKLIKEIEDMVMEDATHIFLYHQDDMSARLNTVKGYPPIAFVNRFETVWLDEES